MRGHTVSAHGNRITDTNGVEDKANKIFLLASLLDMLGEVELQREPSIVSSATSTEKHNDLTR